MSKHTPGPWVARCRHVNYVEGQEWPEYEFLQWEVEGPRVPNGRGEFFQADARLIAAAPELLGCCIKALAAWEGTGPAILLDDLRAAIAKATGEAA